MIPGALSIWRKRVVARMSENLSRALGPTGRAWRSEARRGDCGPPRPPCQMHGSLGLYETMSGAGETHSHLIQARRRHASATDDHPFHDAWLDARPALGPRPA